MVIFPVHYAAAKLSPDDDNALGLFFAFGPKSAEHTAGGGDTVALFYSQASAVYKLGFARAYCRHYGQDRYKVGHIFYINHCIAAADFSNYVNHSLVPLQGIGLKTMQIQAASGENISRKPEGCVGPVPFYLKFTGRSVGRVGRDIKNAALHGDVEGKLLLRLTGHVYITLGLYAAFKTQATLPYQPIYLYNGDLLLAELQQ